MPNNQELIDTALRSQMANYRPAPFVLCEGEGAKVRDVEGNEYLDFVGGIAVLSVGHCHPKLSHAIAEQARRLIHTSNMFYNDAAIRLADALVAKTDFDRVYFANSGAEANEALLKLARRWHFEHGRSEKVELVAALGSFHGRTMGALSLTGQEKYHQGMGPLVPGVKHVPYNDVGALRDAVSDRVAAVLLEPVQGEGGLVIGETDYLRAARQLCDEKGALLFFDEVQTGFGRTGTFFGYEHSGVTPDGVALAKGMGGGFPIGAIAVKEKLADGFPPGSHATTFGGNALACAAGEAVLSIFEEEGLVDNAARVGEHLGKSLERLAADATRSAVVEARGVGLLRGLKLAEGVDARGVLAHLRDRHRLLVSLAGGVVLRMAPPLNVTTEVIDEAVDRLADGLAELST